MKISVITPIYNEEKNIPELFGQLTDALNKIGSSYEIINVVDFDPNMNKCNYHDFLLF